MTVRNLMSGYTAYTDAQELAAVRGTHWDEYVTTTGGLTTTILNFGDDFTGPGNLSMSVYDRQTREDV